MKLASNLVKVRKYSLLPYLCDAQTQHNVTFTLTDISTRCTRHAPLQNKSTKLPQKSKSQSGDTTDPQISDAQARTHTCPTRHTEAPRPTPVPNTLQYVHRAAPLPNDNNRIPLEGTSLHSTTRQVPRLAGHRPVQAQAHGSCRMSLAQGCRP